MKENSRRYLGRFKWRDAAELRAFLAERYITAVFKRRNDGEKNGSRFSVATPGPLVFFASMPNRSGGRLKCRSRLLHQQGQGMIREARYEPTETEAEADSAEANEGIQDAAGGCLRWPPYPLGQPVQARGAGAFRC